MIVKDEEQTLERAISGITSVADEIIIVDTGSTDNSVEIAKKYTDKVFNFDWGEGRTHSQPLRAVFYSPFRTPKIAAT